MSYFFTRETFHLVSGSWKCLCIGRFFFSLFLVVIGSFVLICFLHAANDSVSIKNGQLLLSTLYRVTTRLIYTRFLPLLKKLCMKSRSSNLTKKLKMLIRCFSAKIVTYRFARCETFFFQFQHCKKI